MVDKEEANSGEDGGDELSLDKIIIALENIESQNLRDDESIQNWLSQITSPEFKLIEGFINLFLDSMNDAELSNTIFKVLIKLNYYQKEIVQPQLQDSPQLFKNLINYLTKLDKSKLSGEPFILLLNICQKSDFEKLNTEDFVKVLLNSLTILNDEETMHSLIRILTSINYQIEDDSQNCFLKVFGTHENSRFFGESLLRILNFEEDKSTMYRILQCLIDILDHTKSSFFYSTDLESFINIAIKKLESTYTDKLRFYILKVLERITFYDDYYKMRYKIDLLEELMENYETNEEVEEENQQMASKILENIRKHK